MFKMTINHKSGPVDYEIFTEDEANEQGLEYSHWKVAPEGTFGLSDDGYIGLVIKRKMYDGNRMGDNEYIRMPWGYTFYNPKYHKKKFKARGRMTPHTLSGKREIEVKLGGKKGENLAQVYAQCGNYDLAIDWTYGDHTQNEHRTYKRWMKSETFKKMVREELNKLLKDKGFSEAETIDMLREAIEMAKDKKDVTNLMRAVENLQDMHGMKDKEKQVQTTQLEATATRKLLDTLAEEERVLKLREVKSGPATD